MTNNQTKAVAAVRDSLEGLGPKIAAIAPNALNLDRFVGVVVHAVQKTPKLLECNPTSLLSAVMESAALGLTPSGVLGESYLVPRGGTVNLQVGYKGLVKLALESGQVRQIVARPVYKKDRFRYSFGLEEDTFEHIPTEDPERGQVVRAYAIARMVDGPAQLEVTALADILQAKAVAQTSNVWDQWFGAMAAKTSVRRLCRLLTLSPEYHRALAIDDGEIAPGEDRDFGLGKTVDVPAKSKAAAAADRLRPKGADPRKAPEPEKEPEPEETAPPTGDVDPILSDEESPWADSDRDREEAPSEPDVSGEDDAPEEPEPASRKAGKATIGKLQGAANRAGATPEQLEKLAVAAGAESLESLTMAQAREVKTWLESKAWVDFV